MAPRVVHALEVVHVDHDAVHVVVVAPGERQFAETPIHERAAVRNLGERIRRRRFEKFAGDGLFGGVLEFHLQDHRAKLQAVVGPERGAGDGVAVDIGPVGAAEVFHGDAGAVKGELAVLAAHEFVVQVDVGVLPASEDDAPYGKGNLLKLGLRVQHDEMRADFARSKSNRLISCDDSLV